MKQKRYRYFIYVLIRVGVTIIGFIPAFLMYPFARTVGWCLYHLLAKERNKILSHLHCAYGEQLDLIQRKRIARYIFMNFGVTIAEMLKMNHERPGRLLQRIYISENDRKTIQDLMRGGKGIMFSSAHIGNWEALAAFLNHSFCGDSSLLVVAKRIYYKKYNDMLLTFRRRFGVETIYRDTPFIKVVKHLKKGGGIGILTDQDIRSIPGVFVPFFGRPAYTSDAQAKLAMLSGAPIVPTFMVRKGRMLHFVIGAPILVNKDNDKTVEVHRITRRIAEETEAVIRRFPDQWAWMHRRWKTRPEDISLQSAVA